MTFTPDIWRVLKYFYLISSISTYIIIGNSFYTFLASKPISICKIKNKKKDKPIDIKLNSLCLLIGKDVNTHTPVYLYEKSLYQNILITGTIGSGKTSSIMYPFSRQLIKYMYHDKTSTLPMLILDVKGNFYSKILEYVTQYNRSEDLLVISLDSDIYYNPLHKPNLSALTLANRLKTILSLFSPNNSDSYWLDKVEQVICECIKFCRLYNDGYVTFEELHKLVTVDNYYRSKYEHLRFLFQSGSLCVEEVYNLKSSIEFFEKEFYNLDHRTLSIIKSEITRITGCFVSDYKILKLFSPSQKEINFYGFKDMLDTGKIVTLNMNLSEHSNFSRIIATYLKLDFQTEVLLRLKEKSFYRPCIFMSDEFHEYITSTDANFLAQSREAKCINILSTQSYSSFENTLKDKNTVKVITQNMINKIWLRNDDIFTIEEAIKQIGKEDKLKVNKSISESAKETNYNFFTNSLYSLNSNISESISTNIQFDYKYDTCFFTQQLEAFSCLCFLSDGIKILPPQKVKLIPYFEQDF